jgi:hypothetical protein
MNKTTPELPASFVARVFSAVKAPFVAALQTQFVSSIIALVDPFFTAVVNLFKAVIAKIPGLARGLPMLFLAGGLFYFVMQLNPAKLGPTLYFYSRIAGAAFLGYWLDRWMYPYARPHDEPVGIARGAAMKRRALIVSAAIVSAGFAP